MSWSDIFFPGNPEKRERLVRKSQEIQELMKNNFRATNQLIEALKEHLDLSFRPIKLNEKATVKENCDVIIERIHEIQAEVQKIDEKLKAKLEPTLYEKLKNMSLSARDYHRVSGYIRPVCGVGGSAAVLAVGWLIKNERILTNMRLTFGLIKTTALATVVVGLLFVGIDIIMSVILGAMERDELERALKEYDEVLEEFRPVSEKYQDSITHVRVRLEMSQ
ncbi:hypothetical protein ABG768_009474 [Culter alburnus]|uniref:Single-pass membrane protein with coiled-coil domains 3 n=1 Tax=Culter alburnus TaxID=194366 RepID=A0AAW1ZDA9_CULAL